MDHNVNRGPSVSTSPNIVNQQVPQNPDNATLPLTGTETVEITQNGATVLAPVSAIAANENPMTTAGDMIVGGTAGAPTRLAKGTDGKVLTMVSGSPAWAVVVAIRRVTIDTTMSNSDGSIVIDAGVAVLPGLTLKLPPTPVNGQRHFILALGATASNTFTIDGNGHNLTGSAATTISGASTVTSALSDGSFIVQFDTADSLWYVLNAAA